MLKLSLNRAFLNNSKRSCFNLNDYFNLKNNNYDFNFTSNLRFASKYNRSLNNILNKSFTSTTTTTNSTSSTSHISSYSNKKFLFTPTPILSSQTKFISNMTSKEVAIPMPWGFVKGQIFGDASKRNAIPIIAIHGYLDNSNSFQPIAPYICDNNDYYIIAIDLPGHGQSSKLPDGIPYTPKIFLATVRRIVKHFHINHFIFLNHSYGVNLAFMYDVVFHNEIKAILAIDWIFGFAESQREDLSIYWKSGMDKYINFENVRAGHHHRKRKEPLTKEKALELLKKANRGVDEFSAKILLERSLITKEDGTLEFSRDYMVNISMSEKDHYVDIIDMFPDYIKYLKAPTLALITDSSAFGENALKNTLRLLNHFNQASNQIEIQRYTGFHHYHMTNPKEAAEIILKFLDKLHLHKTAHKL